MDSELDKINIDDYIKNHSDNDNSLFLYNYYLESEKRIYHNYYKYSKYITIPLRIDLCYKMLEKKASYDTMSRILLDVDQADVQDKTYYDEVTQLFRYLMELHKQKKFDANQVCVTSKIFRIDPLFALEEDFNNLKYIYNVDFEDIDEPDFIRKILDLSIKKNYTFDDDMYFIRSLVLRNFDALVYFIDNCKYSGLVYTEINDYLDGLDKKDAYYIYQRVKNEEVRDFLGSNLNFDNYDLNTVVDSEPLYLFEEGDADQYFIINYLNRLKKRGFNQDIILVVQRVNMHLVDEAYKLFGDQIKISPLENQEYRRTFEGIWDRPAYSVDEIRSSEKALDMYSKTVEDKYDKDGDIKHLSPLERFIAAYILTTKFYPYTREKNRKKDYHVSRSVYEFVNKITGRKIVCVGYVHLLRELLYRMGITDTVRWDVRQNERKKRGIDLPNNHSRMLIHLVDPKYDIDGIYMSDPTYDERGLLRTVVTHMLMTKKEALEMDKGYRDQELHLDNIEEMENEFDVFNVPELLDKPIPKDTIIKAFLAVYHFLDKNMKMTDNYTKLEYHRMARQLGLESNFSQVDSPVFSKLIKLSLNKISEYREVYGNLAFAFPIEFRDYIYKKIKNSGYYRINMNFLPDVYIISYSDITYKALKACGYDVNDNKAEYRSKIFEFKKDVPLYKQIDGLIERINAINNVLDNMSLEKENKSIK